MELSAADMAAYMPVVRSVVMRFLGRVPANVLREDLIAAGTFGLIDALRKDAKFTVSRGAGFDWYARVRIRGAVLDELRSQDWLSRRERVRVRLANKDRDVGATVVPFTEEHDALAARLTPQELLEVRHEQEALAVAIENLPERERRIVRMHYFEDVQFKAIAKELGVSEPRISQLHTRALTMLRESVAA
jgi:RNA polymerase sigma factor for flagellar operon FliA